ncbi:MAG TPA: acyl-CoA dehydrogenase family protein [Candidatus Krumholzibacteriaceae bacterium]|nr:acyl-CoA dehydrogenase family protein [Candidatus Krumholzibacteriaceae bacterium]
MAKPFPWWNEKHKKLAEEAKKFADQNLSRGEEITWTKEFPMDVLRQVGEKGWFGTLIPEAYGGMGVGVTGNCIVTEELSRIGAAVSGAYCVTMFGGVEQLLLYGSETQKQKWLPPVAKGKVIAAIGITEPAVGSDAAGMETTARREGDEYVLKGKKRFITNAGVADMHLIYAKTSDKSEDKAKYAHLSAFLVKKGTPGFSIERINELQGWPGLPNGFLDLDEVRVPVENLIAGEGMGWKILVDGLNFERVLFTSGMLGPMREAIRYAVGYAQRRVQFGQPTAEFQVNQFHIADMFAGLKTARLLVYYAAHLLDTKAEAMVEAAAAKLYTSETFGQVMNTAIQVMGGDGWTQFYPVESFMRDSKVNQIGAGTSEIMRTIIYRGELRALTDELKMPVRKVHEKLGVPISTTEPLPKVDASEKGVLEVLAENYRVNPGLYMTREEIKQRLTSVTDADLDKLLTTLETKDMARLYRDKRGAILMARASHKGLKEAKPLDYYKWFPEWFDKDYIF